MSLQDIQAEHRRLAILRVLETAPDYSCNDSILDDALKRVGVSGSRAQIRADIAWLNEAGCVTYEALSSLVVATITQQGLDVVSGEARVPGIKRPSPKERR